MATKAKKSYGQHFLIDTSIAERIAASVKGSEGYQKLLEVGPGKGMLTQYLKALPYELYMVEADRDMVDYLKTHFSWSENHLLQANFLKVPLDEYMKGNTFGLVGNFPYNISSQIVFQLIRYREHIPEMVGMFQKEMAERIVAEPGSKTYGVISVLSAAFYYREYLFSVGRHAFQPPPKVKSAVIRLVRKTDDPLGCDYELLRKVVKQAFSQRRKMLRNTMKTFIKGDELLKKDFFNNRPEQLSLSQFVMLTNWIAERIQ